MDKLAPGHNLGHVIDGIGAGCPSLSFHRPGPAKRHEHESAYICCVLSGCFEEDGDATQGLRRSGDYVVHPVGETHSDTFGEQGAVCLNLHFPANWGRVEARARPLSGSGRALVEQLAAEVLKGERSDGLMLDSLIAELQSLACPAAPDNGGHWIDAVIEAIGDEPGRRWSLGELAALCNRHPVHLARTFRARIGMTIGDWRRRVRATRAAIAASEGSKPLAVIAHEFGYADQSHMTREFRELYRTTPSRFGASR
jgi:AraC family transcriptional regulator